MNRTKESVQFGFSERQTNSVWFTFSFSLALNFAMSILRFWRLTADPQQTKTNPPIFTIYITFFSIKQLKLILIIVGLLTSSYGLGYKDHLTTKYDYVAIVDYEHQERIDTQFAVSSSLFFVCTLHASRFGSKLKHCILMIYKVSMKFVMTWWMSLRRRGRVALFLLI